MIDKSGYRLNVGIIIANRDGKLFWGSRTKSHGWQFPQGGVHPYETLEETMYRELKEEVGLSKKDVKIIAVTKRWLHYNLPKHMIRNSQEQTCTCIGQKQKWFLLSLVSPDNKICLDASEKPEFNKWSWVEYWEPLKHVIYFKKDIYRRVLTEFENKINIKH